MQGPQRALKKPNFEGPQVGSQTSRTFHMCVYIDGYRPIFDDPSNCSKLPRTDKITLCNLHFLAKYLISLCMFPYLQNGDNACTYFTLL